MKLELLGQFTTDDNGQIVVSDPCYSLTTKENKKIKVKPGTYDVYTIIGKPKKSYTSWDKLPGTFRNAELVIVHADHSGKVDFTKLGSIGVDSGQAGFFNTSTYKQKSPIPVEMNNYWPDIYREELPSYYSRVKKEERALKNKKSEEFLLTLKTFKGDQRKTIEFLKLSLNNSKQMLALAKADYKNSLKGTKTLRDEQVKPPQTDFYKIQMNATAGEFKSGVTHYGAVSRTGLGDGTYSLMVARNKNQEIIACCLEYFSLNEMK